MRALLVRSSFALLVAVAGCGGSQHGSGDGGPPSGDPYSIDFVPLVAGQPFSCTQSYPNIGTTQSTLSPQDFRMYVHDVQLIAADGSTVPLTLDDDGVYQGQGVALLDFEDGTGGCNTASPTTHMSLQGHAPAGSYSGVKLTLGVPAALDHLNAVTAAAPLNQPALWWSWTGGFKYLKVDVQTTGNSSYFFHLGAEDCTGSSMTTIDCQYPNLDTVTLTGFVPGKNKVAVDLGTLFAQSNLDLQPDMMTTFSPGCMSLPGDAQCPAPFAQLGLGFDGAAAPASQAVFTVQ